MNMTLTAFTLIGGPMDGEVIRGVHSDAAVVRYPAKWQAGHHVYVRRDDTESSGNLYYEGVKRAT